MKYKKLAKRRLFRIESAKVFFLLLLVILVLLLFISYLEIDQLKYHQEHRILERIYSKRNGVPHSNQQYLINTSQCKIPEPNPFFEGIERFYHYKEYSFCSKEALLSYIEQDNNSITLNINQTLVPLYTSSQINCCYSKVTRHRTAKNPDNGVRISDCIQFEGSVVVVDPLVMVTCTNSFFMTVYSNVHAIISPSHIPSLKTYETIPRPNSTFSVLLIGIDSISKSNLVRTMARTHNFLETKKFINLKGYTKVGSNTLPNLIGMLAGQTMKQLEATCDYENDINDCAIIWDKFKEMDYVTAYGEDSSYIGTFNYAMKGFEYPPTDFYFRPYMLAAEKLGVTKRDHMCYCAGPETEGERIMNLAKDFLITLKNYPKFGLFWMNSFSHDDLNMPLAMDQKVEEFLETIYQHLDNTILFFFSDHGLRFGEIRNTHTGWLEEKLPFFYVYVPQTFQNFYPEEYKNILINSQRLTNGFDIYMTLQNILVLADQNFFVQQSEACPKCQSLFSNIPEERTCDDAAIHTNWCVCNVRVYINPQEAIVQDAAHFFVEEINQLVSSYRQGHKCYVYDLDAVTYSGMSQFINDQNQTAASLLLRVKTKPEATFEGLIELPENSISKSKLVGDITRLDRYAPYSECVESSSLEKYCYCKESTYNKFKKNICKVLFNCLFSIF